MHARIFIGGLLDSIQDADIVKLFSSFGKVMDIDRMDYKERRYLKGTKLMRLRYERRIAFLTLDVKEDKAVQRAVRALHGTKWKGATLRCQLAKPSGLDRIRNEIEEERNHHDFDDNEDQEGVAHDDVLEEVVTKKPFDGAFVTSRMHSQDNKTYFGSDTDDDEHRLDNVWAEIETPKQHVYNYEQHLEKCSRMVAETRDDEDDDDDKSDIDLRPKTKDLGLVEAFLKEQENRRTVEFGKKTAGNTVDFFSQEDVSSTHAGRGIDLSRFDDSDDDDNGEFRIPQVDGADDDDDNDGVGEKRQQKDGTLSSTEETSTSSSSSDDDEEEEEHHVHDDEDSDIEMAELQSLFPNGALFHRGDDTNMEQLQATWRVEGERMRKDFKHIKKQAKRSQRIPPSIYTNE
ncbi:hypothetical protein M9434_004586 [Picochlorum sp. BPE23]|nr:hypothetical protein M9434_004586 [Picochlorum sp. BPE23]